MHVDIDKFANLDSPIHRWDTRFKISSLLLCIFCISALNSICIAFTANILTFALAAYSQLPWKFLFQKIKYPFIFLLALFLFLPISSGGNALYDFKYFKIYFDGLYLSFLIFFKAIAIITLLMTMLGTSSFNDSVKSLLALKIPAKLVNLILFTYRYIFVYLETLRKMRISLTLRGYRNKNSIMSLKSTAGLIGSILVRSFDQTDRIYKAMLLRGFEQEIPVKFESHFKAADVLKSGFVLVIFCTLIILDRNI